MRITGALLLPFWNGCILVGIWVRCASQGRYFCPSGMGVSWLASGYDAHNRGATFALLDWVYLGWLLGTMSGRGALLLPLWIGGILVGFWEKRPQKGGACDLLDWFYLCCNLGTMGFQGRCFCPSGMGVSWLASGYDAHHRGATFALLEWVYLGWHLGTMRITGALLLPFWNGCILVGIWVR